jgi:endonuclease/exonuclease/phosphatase family metal-dependent hydrolase
VDAEAAVLHMPLDWQRLDNPSQARRMAADCDAVGPVLYAQTRRIDPDRPIETIVIVSWNVHVGGGDLAEFVRRLREGAFTGGAPVTEFVLLLQEAFRAGAAVPPIAPGVHAPARIDVRTPRGTRDDILASARTLNLNVFYAPSMRNGRGDSGQREDRGNAILSTIPLTALRVIELPYERQRRVALEATVSGTGGGGGRWQVRVSSAQLNAGSSWRRLWLLSSAVRDEQAERLAALVTADQVPRVLGVDLNTWAGGPYEPAYRVLRREFPQTPGSSRAPFMGAIVLDHLFFRLPAAWPVRAAAVRERFGSDHRPIVASLTPVGQ